MSQQKQSQQNSVVRKDGYQPKSTATPETVPAPFIKPTNNPPASTQVPSGPPAPPVPPVPAPTTEEK